MTDSLSHLPPGRQAAVDALTSERFGWPVWWTPPDFVDTRLTQGKRRRALSEALDAFNDEEAPDGVVQDG